MSEQEFSKASNALQGIDAVPFPGPSLPVPLPFFAAVSGLYEWQQRLIIRPPFPHVPLPVQPVPELPPRPPSEPIAAAVPGTAAVEALVPWWLQREELRLDVDGPYPQMVASGTVFRGLTTRVHWIANLAPNGTNTWTGTIWYKDGDASVLPYTNVDITVVRSLFASQRRATLTLSGGGVTPRLRTFVYKSAYFHDAEFEFDTAAGVTAGTSMQTHAHPNRPATLPDETLTIATAFNRAGFAVKTSSEQTIIPLSGAGTNARWSDMEMHDAMQTYWSRFAATAQWSMWVFFAALHEQGTSLGGVMFDDIGPNHRQGTAIFNESFIANAPVGDANPTAWVERMKFWTACHEMGHSFNLAHSWQKQHPPSWGTPWIPLANEVEERSFMNYPYNVTGGQTAFFADFEYRFSDSELLFMRHAPARFVQMGNADWFDDHGFRQANVSPEPPLQLEVRVNRSKPVFEFLEPVVLELKLKNISTQPQLVPANLLSSTEHMTVIVKKQGKPARQFGSFAQYCLQPATSALMPGNALYESLFVSAGRNGWDVAEPGHYTVQIALHLEALDIVSAPLQLRVAPPRGYDEEWVAQDFFSDDVGRILTFDGSRVLTKGLDTLRETTERLSDRRVTHHAQIALGNALARDYKVLDLGEGRSEISAVHAIQGDIKVERAHVEEARTELHAALLDNRDIAVESLGHIDYKWYADRFSDWLAAQGAPEEAMKVQTALYQTLSARKVLEGVLHDIAARRDSYERKRRKS
jgi:hypothetical protein